MTSESGALRLAPPSANEGERLSARETLALAFSTFGRDGVALSSSFSVEDMVLLDLISTIEPRPRVFTLDTGRLPRATHDVMELAEQRYGITVEVHRPDRQMVAEMVSTRGRDLFYESVDNRRYCCFVRKVVPLQRALAGLDAWIVGLRREHSEARGAVSKVALDDEHGGLWKFAPLADWTEARVWQYVRDNDVPVNELYARGYRSIGCAPCTRPIGPDQPLRAGRWWWEDDGSAECGIHPELIPPTDRRANAGRVG